MLSFKDFITVNYAGGQSEMQDYYAAKRHHGVTIPEEKAELETKLESHWEDSRNKQQKNIQSLHGKAQQP